MSLQSIDGRRIESVWVLIPHHSYEGHGEPLRAYTSKAAADDALELLSHAHGSSFKVYEVPLK